MLLRKCHCPVILPRPAMSPATTAERELPFALRYRAHPIIGNLCADYQCPPTVKPKVRGAAGEYESPVALALANR